VVKSWKLRCPTLILRQRWGLWSTQMRDRYKGAKGSVKKEIKMIEFQNGQERK
jgi:hypothetical protein